jgi:hypothetical protein
MHESLKWQGSHKVSCICGVQSREFVGSWQCPLVKRRTWKFEIKGRAKITGELVRNWAPPSNTRNRVKLICEYEVKQYKYNASVPKTIAVNQFCYLIYQSLQLLKIYQELDGCCLYCDALWTFTWLLQFQRNILPPYTQKMREYIPPKCWYPLQGHKTSQLERQRSLSSPFSISNIKNDTWADYVLKSWTLRFSL